MPSLRQRWKSHQQRRNDVSRGSDSVVRAAEVAPKCLLRYEEEKTRLLESGVYVAKTLKKRREEKKTEKEGEGRRK